MFSAAEVFDLAIRIEENGERFYRQAIENVSDPSLRRLLEWNADEEVGHRKSFMAMKKTVKEREDSDLAEQLGSLVVQDAVSDHAFSLEEVDFSSIPDENVLIQTAIGFEKDSILFYEIIESFVTDPETLREVRRIMDEERKHIALLEERRSTL